MRWRFARSRPAELCSAVTAPPDGHGAGSLGLTGLVDVGEVRRDRLDLRVGAARLRCLRDPRLGHLCHFRLRFPAVRTAASETWMYSAAAAFSHRAVAIARLAAGISTAVSSA